jgi:hypothetical protein
MALSIKATASIFQVLDAGTLALLFMVSTCENFRLLPLAVSIINSNIEMDDVFGPIFKVCPSLNQNGKDRFPLKTTLILSITTLADSICAFTLI